MFEGSVLPKNLMVQLCHLRTIGIFYYKYRSRVQYVHINKQTNKKETKVWHWRSSGLQQDHFKTRSFGFQTDVLAYRLIAEKRRRPFLFCCFERLIPLWSQNTSKISLMQAAKLWNNNKRTFHLNKNNKVQFHSDLSNKSITCRTKFACFLTTLMIIEDKLPYLTE